MFSVLILGLSKVCRLWLHLCVMKLDVKSSSHLGSNSCEMQSLSYQLIKKEKKKWKAKNSSRILNCGRMMLYIWICLKRILMRILIKYMCGCSPGTLKWHLCFIQRFGSTTPHNYFFLCILKCIMCICTLCIIQLLPDIRYPCSIR